MDSPQVMHAAVMASFPSFGSEERGRILWRIDRLGSSTYVLVQSGIRPDFSHMVDQFGWPEAEQKWETLDYSAFLERLEAGQNWRFRLTANPVHSILHEGSERGKVLAHVTVQQQIKWLTDRAEKNGFSVCEDNGCPALTVVDRGVRSFDRSGHKVTVSYATFEGVLTITDVDLFRKAVENGIGREKAYGCGMITLSR